MMAELCIIYFVGVLVTFVVSQICVNHYKLRMTFPLLLLCLKVWIMLENYPTRQKIIKVKVRGGTEDENGQTPDLGKVLYVLEYDPYTDYTEEQLCDTFEQLRDRVFSEDLKEQ